MKKLKNMEPERNIDNGFICTFDINDLNSKSSKSKRKGITSANKKSPAPNPSTKRVTLLMNQNNLHSQNKVINPDSQKVVNIQNQQKTSGKLKKIK